MRTVIYVLLCGLQVAFGLVGLVGLVGWVKADDWPTFRHDQRRSGVSTDELSLGNMSQAWRWQSPLPPVSAWPDAARWDAYSQVEGMRSMRDYDSAFQPVISDSKVLIASNVDDSLHCFELTSGKPLWRVTADAPIRVAPTLAQGHAYFGADDGCVYAVELSNGSLVWKRQLVDAELFINDGRLCSFQPVRTGVLLDEANNTLLAGAGLFPWQSSNLFALNAADGQIVWQKDIGTGWTIEGPMLLGSEHIVSPQGRAPPQLFGRSDGTPVGALSGGGGSFALLTDEGEVLHGPGNKGGWLTASRANSREPFTSFEKGVSMVVRGQQAFLLDAQGVTVIDRETQQPLWKSNVRAGEELILVGSSLIVGGDGYVAALAVSDGKLQWVSPITGRGRGLAAAQGHLVVSTDQGELSVFSSADISHAATTDSGSADTAVPGEWVSLVGFAEVPVQLETFATAEAAAAKPWPSEWELTERWTFRDPGLSASTASTSIGNAENAEQTKRIASDIVNGHAIELPAHSRFVQLGNQHALVLAETIDTQVSSDFRQVDYPRESLTVMATVRIDQEQPWGGLMSMSQDNGDFERGWILGYQNRQFGFAVNGQEGDPGLSWALSKEVFRPGQWYQVVGTYDGSKTSLYVNGQLAAEHTSQRGPIDYPERAAFQLASYRDDDEHFYSRGRLHSLALSKRALKAEEIGQLYELTSEELGDEFQREAAAKDVAEHIAPVEGVDQFAMSNFQMDFIAPATAQVQWTTAEPSICRLKLLDGAAELELVATDVAEDASPSPRPQQQHHWLIRGVDQREVVRFCIEQKQDAQKQDAGDIWLSSAQYQCDGHFDYTRPVLSAIAPSDSSEVPASYLATKQLLPALPGLHPRGLALVAQDHVSTGVAEALCMEGGMDVIVLVPAGDEAGNQLLVEVRQQLQQRGLYGRPISVRPLSDLDKIPGICMNIVWLDQTDDSEKLVASDLLEQRVAPGGFFIGQRSQLTAVSRAKGYSAVINETQSSATSTATKHSTALAVYRKPRLNGAAGWTHMYGLPDNTAFAGETLSGATYADQLQVAWAGRPGPRYQSDRGNRKPSPLAARGRLYLQGHYRLISMDAHNGSILWSKELPKMVRFNVPRDCSNWCCDTQALYVAIADGCVKLDGATGEQLAEFKAPKNSEHSMNWGFVSRHADLLIGSSVAPTAAFTGYWGKEFWYDAKDGEHAKKVAADILFAVDSDSGEERWRYDSALVLHPTICISQDRIVFTECRSEALRIAESRRLDGDELWNNLFVVALDAKTGQKLWETPAKPMPGVAALYGVSTNEQYLLQTSTGGEFAMYSLDLEDGAMQWRGKYGWEADHHGKHLSRPAVVGDKIFLRPLTLDRKTGNVLAKSFPVGHQCGTYTCSSNALFLRAGNLAMWDGISTDATRWDRMRPDCWVSTIPAEGMLLSPEGGGGCSCGGWLETSVGFGIRTNP